MAAESWREFYRRVLEHEAKICEDVPGDRGGPTKWGITIFDYAETVGKKVPMLDKETINRSSPVFKQLRDELFAVTPEWIENQYRKKYWNGVRADELPRGVDYAVADFGVNSGPYRAIQTLQRLCGNKPTGRMDDETVRETCAMQPVEVVNHYCDMRVEYLNGIVAERPSQRKFLRGWMNRVRDVRQAGLTWAAQEVPPPPPPMAKAVVPEEPKVSVAKVAAKSQSNWWLMLGGVGGWIEKKFGFLQAALPDAQRSVEDVVDPLTSLGSMLRVNMGDIVAVVTLVTLLVVLVRHTRDRVELEKTTA